MFGQGGKVGGETDKLNIDSIIARLLEGDYINFTLFSILKFHLTEFPMNKDHS